MVSLAPNPLFSHPRACPSYTSSREHVARPCLSPYHLHRTTRLVTNEALPKLEPDREASIWLTIPPPPLSLQTWPTLVHNHHQSTGGICARLTLLLAPAASPSRLPSEYLRRSRRRRDPHYEQLSSKPAPIPDQLKSLVGSVKPRRRLCVASHLHCKSSLFIGSALLSLSLSLRVSVPPPSFSI